MGLLMLNDIFLSPREERLISRGSVFNRRRHLMTQLLAPFELLNTPDPRRLIIRSHVFLAELLQDQAVLDDIKNRSRGFDIPLEF